MPAFAQASSWGCPFGAPLSPTAPIVSLPIMIGTPPPSGMTSLRLRCPKTSLPGSVRFAHSAEGLRNVRAVYAFLRASSRLCGDALSPCRNTRKRPARSSTATDTRGVHSFSAVSAMVKASLMEMFFSVSTCAGAGEDAAISAARIVTRPNRVDIGILRVILVDGDHTSHGSLRKPSKEKADYGSDATQNDQDRCGRHRNGCCPERVWPGRQPGRQFFGQG